MSLEELRLRRIKAEAIIDLKAKRSSSDSALKSGRFRPITMIFKRALGLCNDNHEKTTT